MEGLITLLFGILILIRHFEKSVQMIVGGVLIVLGLLMVLGLGVPHLTLR